MTTRPVAGRRSGRGPHLAVAAVLVTAAMCAGALGSSAVAGADDEGAVRVSTTIEGRQSATVQLRLVCRAGDRQVVDRVLVFDGDETRRVGGIEAPASCRLLPAKNEVALLIHEIDGAPVTGSPRFRVTPGALVEVATTASYPSSTAIGTVRVTKRVVGVPPTGATHVVEVRCDGAAVQALTFPAAGGTAEAVVDVAVESRRCTVRETGGGGDRKRYRPRGGTVTVDVDRPAGDVTVTNVYR